MFVLSSILLVVIKIRKFFFFFFVVILICSFSFPVFSQSYDYSISSDSVRSDSRLVSLIDGLYDELYYLEDLVVSSVSSFESVPQPVDSDQSEQLASDSSLSFSTFDYAIFDDVSFNSNLDVTVLSTLDPITPSNTTGFKSVLLSVIGSYDSIVTEYKYTNTNGTVSYLREVTPDYVWLVSAAIFAIVLYCVFRLGGSLLCRL